MVVVKQTLDLDSIRLPLEMVRISKFQCIQTEWFIKGPIPGAWILKAATLHGDYTIRVALAICYAQGMASGKDVILDRFHFNKFQIKKDSARRALQRLQKAGLISYHKKGQKFVVTILDVRS